MSARIEVDERADFDAWYTLNYGWGGPEWLDEESRYAEHEAQRAWEAWQIRASRADRASAAPTEGVEPAPLTFEQAYTFCQERWIMDPVEALMEWTKANPGGVVVSAIDADKLEAKIRQELSAAPTRPAAPDAVEALRELSDMYTHAWDCEDGTLRMLGGSISKFEEAHERARSVLQQIDGKKG